MNSLPVLKVTETEFSEPVIMEFEQAGDFFKTKGRLVIVEDRLISSFEELKALITTEAYNRKKVLEVRFMPIFYGG